MSRSAMQPGSISSGCTITMSGADRFTARIRCRGFDGRYHRPSRCASTAAEAEQLARAAALTMAQPGLRTSPVTADTPLSVLLDLWLEEEQLLGRLRGSTLEMYRREIDLPTRRNLVGCLKIKAALGNLTVRDADTPTLNRYIKFVAQQGQPAKAQTHRRILHRAMQVAIRDGALSTNPVEYVVHPYRSHDTEPDAVPVETLAAFHNHATQFVHANPRRDPRLLCAIQLLDETGVRTAELLALRLSDAEVDDRDRRPGLWVRGQLVDSHFLPARHPLRDHGGWVWAPWTKTGQRGIRRLALAPSGADLVRQLLASYTANEFQLLLPARNGRPWNPANFRRTWRKAAGKDYLGITPKSYRKRVATDLTDAENITAAAEQLGNSPRVAEAHYAARNRRIDHSHTLASRQRGYRLPPDTQDKLPHREIR